LQHIDGEKSNLQEETRKLLQQNDSLTAHYKSMLEASKLEAMNLFHQLLSTKLNSNENTLLASIFIDLICFLCLSEIDQLIAL
jgi:predicted nuclease with TOPRIM domain